MKRLPALILVVTASVLGWAQAPDCVSLTQQALQISGVDQQIDVTAQMLSSDDYLREIAADKPDGGDFIAVFKPIVQKDFNGAVLKKDLMRKVVARCKPQQMQEAIAELQSPFVAHMLQLEAARYTPEGQEKLKKYMRIVSIAPPPDSQVSSADAFDDKVGLTDLTVDYMLTITRGVLAGGGAPEEVISQLESRRKQMKAQLQPTAQASILVTYTGVSKSDLAKYGDELTSGPLKWYYDKVHESMLEVLAEHAQAIGKDLKSTMMAQKN